MTTWSGDPRLAANFKDIERANELALNGEYEDVIGLLQERKTSRSNRVKVASGLLLSQIFSMQDQPNKAIEELNSLDELVPGVGGFDESNFYFLKPIAYYDAGQTQDALKLMQEWENSDGFKNWLQFIEFGRMYDQLGDFVSAVRMFENAVKYLGVCRSDTPQ